MSRRIPVTYLAYVFLLTGFVALGCFVYALAVESPYAIALGAGVAVCYAAAVVGFRVGARRTAATDESGNPVDGANIWAHPVRRSQIERYLLTYRGVPAESRERVVSLGRRGTSPTVQRAA